MATLVSPGVSVTVTDESLFIPATAPTVPLIFIATADEKKQADGVTDAQGTFEHDVVRTVTSKKRMIQLYGVPKFLESVDSSGINYQHHGDARNEYGLFALNQFLGVGNLAYVVRANVNLDDNPDSIRNMWDRKMQDSRIVLINLATSLINEYNTINNLLPSDPGYKTTITPAELLVLQEQATIDVFESYSFQYVEPDFIADHSANPLDIYGNGLGNPPTGQYYGLIYIVNNIGSLPNYPGGGTVAGEFTPNEAGDVLLAAADDMKYTSEFRTQTSLGANDDSRRAAIVQALQATINSNTEVRSDTFEYNLVLCPGYPEVVDELVNLVADIKEEAFVIGDTPVDLDPEGITNPTTGSPNGGWAVSPERQISTNLAYYYPWGMGSNLDGKDVVCAPSGIALRTFAYSDNVSYLWYAPAGLRRGLITGISGLGYVSGTLGGPTKFMPVNLDQGQRDALYQYAPSGNINPLVFFPGNGFVVWGQKCSTNVASALDRVNVSRLVKYIKRQLRKHSLIYVFEPNDQITRNNLKATVDNFLKDLVVKRGLYDFATICDESNNTPDRIDRNEMYCDIAIKPVKSAEFIYIPIRVVSTGADLTQ